LRKKWAKSFPAIDLPPELPNPKSPPTEVRRKDSSPSPMQPQKQLQRREANSRQFDPNDLDRTIQWAEAAGMELVKNRNNAIRLRADLEKFDDEIKAHVGKKVCWRLKVTAIEERFVVVRDRFRSESGSEVLLLESADL